MSPNAIIKIQFQIMSNQIMNINHVNLEVIQFNTHLYANMTILVFNVPKNNNL